jgi:hypothetical protein
MSDQEKNLKDEELDKVSGGGHGTEELRPRTSTTPGGFDRPPPPDFRGGQGHPGEGIGHEGQ